MKITNKMIDKNLRFRGKLMKSIMSASSEKKYLKKMKRYNKILNIFIKGKKIKGINCSEEWVTRNDGSQIRVRIYKPIHLKEKGPGILWIHGGGYSLGIPELNGITYKRLINERDCVIIAPDYRLSIEAPYPAALKDCYDVLLWVKNHASELGIRDDQLMVGGESAGGGLTAALTLYARDNGVVNIAYQMPLYPMIDDKMTTLSSQVNNVPVWDSKLNEYGWKLYLGDLFGREVPCYAAAARATSYEDLPPTFTYVGDLEPFKDETIEYVKQLREAGVPVDFELYNGCYHAFEMMCPKAKISKKAIDFFMSSFNHAVDHFFAPQSTRTDYQFKKLMLNDIKTIEKWKYEGYIKTIKVDEYYESYNNTGELIGPGGCFGYGVFNEEQLIGLFEYYFINDIIEIGLALNPEYVGKGMGKEFVLSGIEFAIKEFNYTKNYIQLHVNKKNVAAYKVYLKAGFNVYEEGQDVFEMRKYIL